MRLTSKRGFSLIEVLTASAIFLISFTALTGLVAMITNRRTGASKHSAMTRLASEEYQRYVQQGFTALTVPALPYTIKDPDGRAAEFTVTVNTDCNSVLPAGRKLPTGQTCCAGTGNLCCKFLTVSMDWVDSSSPTEPHPHMVEKYTGYLTKSCP